MIIHLIVILLLFIYLTTKIIQKLTDNKLYRNLNWLFWLFYCTSIITLYYGEYNASISIFSIGTLISLLIIFKLVIFTGDIKKDYSFWGLYAITVITLAILLVSIHFFKSAYFKEPPIGNKGLDGNIGPSGEDSKDLNDYDLCHVQVIKYANKVLYDWKLKRGYLDDKLDKQITNIFFKDRIKQICKSDYYTNGIQKYGVVNTIFKINAEIRNIVLYILSYTNGLKFLEDPILNEHSWNNLLDKPETQSPFVKLEDNEIWQCHKCKNYKLNIAQNKDSRNKCIK